MTTETKHTPTAEHFVYLDELRSSGATNMFGAGSWLRDAFGMDRAEASAVLQAWMKTFDGASSVADRIKAARS